MINENELLNDLLQSMQEEEATTLGIEVTNPAFEITNQNQAMYFIRQYKDLEEEQQRINSICDEQLKAFALRLENWRTKQLESTEKQKQFIEDLLKPFTERELLLSNKKTLKLPFGTLGFSKQQPLYEYADDDVLKFLKDHQLNDLIRTKTVESINKIELKKTGIIKDNVVYISNMPVEGLKVTTREDKFTIK
jgi:bifunctional N-acetylglucosamine-1-phosphate-uridyltransferase/glucosamine-1-phosphate-acetyltransferase GlmU-like protein